MVALVWLGLAAACRESPKAPVPVAAGPPSAPATATAPGSVVENPGDQIAAQRYFADQGTIEPPEVLRALVPQGLPVKVIERNEGCGMERLKLAPGRRSATMTVLTTETVPVALAAAWSRAATAGFVKESDQLGRNAQGDTLSLEAKSLNGLPTRLLYAYAGADPEPVPVPTHLTADVAFPLKAMKVAGFEATLLHAVVAGGRVTDVSRDALLLRAPDAKARAAALETWATALTAAGFLQHKEKPELWERLKPQETLIIHPTDDPAGDVLVSHQKRWRR